MNLLNIVNQAIEQLNNPTIKLFIPLPCMKKIALLINIPDDKDVKLLIAKIQKQNKEIIVKETIPDLLDADNLIQFLCPLHKQCTCIENQPKSDIKNIGIHDIEGIVMKELNNIQFIVAKGSSVEIHFIKGDNIIVSKPLAYFENLLPKNLFCRISRYHIINIHLFIKYYSEDGGYVLMQNKEKLSVLGDYKPNFIKTIASLS